MFIIDCLSGDEYNVNEIEILGIAVTTHTTDGHQLEIDNWYHENEIAPTDDKIEEIDEDTIFFILIDDGVCDGKRWLPYQKAE